MRGMAMNMENVFFWNNFNIWYFDITDSKHEMKKIGLYVDPLDLLTKIKTVRTSTTDHEIAILVR